jgi:thiamine biosynthesis lipoprotein
MHESRQIMGMRVTLDVPGADAAALEAAFAEFVAADERFSPFKPQSEVSRINRGEAGDFSPAMRDVLALCEKTKSETDGYFDIWRPDGTLDPSGLVKGWAISKAAARLKALGFGDYCVEAGGDIQTRGRNEAGAEWRVGIRNPFAREEIVKVVCPHGAGVATSGSYAQGAHIYDPHAARAAAHDIVSLTVIGPDIVEADRFATAAFAMGRAGIEFLARQPGLEAYEIDVEGEARMTGGFHRYLP